MLKNNEKILVSSKQKRPIKIDSKYDFEKWKADQMQWLRLDSYIVKKNNLENHYFYKSRIDN